MKRHGLLGVFLMTSLAAACGDKAESPIDPSGGGTGGAGGGTAVSSSASAISTGSSGACTPSCAQGKVCSVTGMCIDAGTCAADGDCTMAGTVCDIKTSQCVPGGCASQEIPAAAVPPNLLIVLDRSCSMNQPPAGQGGPSKWAIASGAIDTLMTDLKGKIRFGITMFPERFTMKANNCLQVDKIPVAVGANNEKAVSATLADPTYAPGNPCVTNIDTGMDQAAKDPGLADATRDDYVVLVTDGAQSGSCGGQAANPATVKTITDLATKGIHTFVIGFGGAVDEAALTSFADAGMEKNPKGPHDCYDASDQASLDAAFQQIATKTIGCVFQLNSTPEDPGLVYAFFDGMSVPRDPTHMNGWDYDPMTNQVRFYGMACQELEQGTVGKVDVVYGCNAPPPK